MMASREKIVDDLIAESEALREELRAASERLTRFSDQLEKQVQEIVRGSTRD